MHYRIYLDSFFLINFYMNYIVLLIASRILKYKSTHLLLRKILAAILGATYACLILIFRLNTGMIKILSYFGMAILMSMIIAGKNSVRHILNGAVLVSFVAAALGGILHIMYYYTFVGYFMYSESASTILVLIGTTIIAPVLLRSIKSIKENIVFSETKIKVELIDGCKKISIPALIDTGNSLHDPFFDKPVSIIASECVSNIDWQNKAYHLIPFSSIGNENGLIPVVKLERMTIDIGSGVYEIDEPFIALYSGKISGSGDYEMILHPEVIQNAKINRREK